MDANVSKALSVAESWSVSYDGEVYDDARQCLDVWYFRSSASGGQVGDYRPFDLQLRRFRELGSSAVLVQPVAVQNDLITFKPLVLCNVLGWVGNGTYSRPFTGSATKPQHASSGQNRSAGKGV